MNENNNVYPEIKKPCYQTQQGFYFLKTRN